MKSIDIFPWNDHFETGVETIDTQHKKLVTILNKLATNVAYESNEKNLDAIFDELKDYTLYHFKTEEAIWDKYLPNAVLNKEHKEVHQRFVETVMRLKSEQDVKPLSVLADEALGFLAKWLASHILDTDRRMAYIVFAVQDGLSIEEAKVQAEDKMSGSSRLFIDIILSIYSTLSSNTLKLMRELKSHQAYEKKVAYQEEYRQLLINISTLFINLPIEQVDSTIQNLLEKMATFVGADRAYIFEYNAQKHTSSNIYEWCGDKILPQIDNLQNFSNDMAWELTQAHMSGNIKLIEDTLAMPQSKFKDLLISQDIKSLVTIPLMQKAECIGFVGFDAVKSKHEFTQDEIDILDLFSNTLVNIRGRKQAEEELSKEKTLLKTLVQNIPDLVWLKDRDGIYMACNKRFEDFFGAKEKDIVGKSDHDFVNKELADFFRINDNKVMKTNKTCINEETITFASDGHVELVQATKIPMHNSDGSVMGVLGISRDITERQHHEKHLEYIAHYDALTGLPNRILLSDRINQALKQSNRHRFSFAVVYLDLDGFKTINDTFGHDYGDKFLELLAKYMQKSLRQGDTIARLGGDEFVVVLLDLKTHEDSLIMIKRLLEASSQKIIVDKIEMQVTASLGVTFFDAGDEIDADQLLRQADQAMYQAKILGKNRFHIFDALKDKKIRTHHESLDEVQKALLNDEFVLYYQPKVNMQSGEVVGTEALIRWNHPEHGILSPSLFLPIVDGHILSVRIGEWVLDSAMRQMSEWKDKGIDVPTSVNVDAMQLQQSDFVEQLKNLLKKYPKVEPKDLILEVLETSALEDIVHISQVMHACLDIGITFSLDDFGTGYSSLTYLKRLPAKELKIDKSFVCGMLEDSDDLAILDGVMSLSSAFRRDVIAEGVESVEHGEMLLKLGCKIAQGYIIAHPMPPENIEEWIKHYDSNEKWKNTSSISREDLPLLYALVEHRAWLSGVLAYIKGITTSLPERNYHECRFGEWLYGIGMEHYKDSSSFIEVEKYHKELHEKTNILVKQYKHNNLEDLEVAIAEIKRLSHDLTLSFKRFEATRENSSLLDI
ncbi:MAG: bacteriohemerythrin [Sulfurimonas sp.]|uniref:bacteriohemerythrin n=1 Tax=Sulfurimonas sp. TaxID=2022749 RepID=UPI0025CD9E2A|nr:bacteriohemerythrin [Sulfurimonas sp.]MCK9490574.1 bacteriohemerythrin [Sulfurimonas sp.]